MTPEIKNYRQPDQSISVLQLMTFWKYSYTDNIASQSPWIINCKHRLAIGYLALRLGIGGLALWLGIGYLALRLGIGCLALRLGIGYLTLWTILVMTYNYYMLPTLRNPFSAGNKTNRITSSNRTGNLH